MSTFLLVVAALTLLPERVAKVLPLQLLMLSHCGEDDEDKQQIRHFSWEEKVLQMIFVYHCASQLLFQVTLVDSQNKYLIHTVKRDFSDKKDK